MTLDRRCWLCRAGAVFAGLAGPRGEASAQAAGQASGAAAPFTVVTFGDSVLDCGGYNPYGVHPGALLVRNDDVLFPEFRGRDLTTRGPARLLHRATDGATVDDLARQRRGVAVAAPSAVLLSVGGNDLLRGLAADRGPGVRAFERTLQSFVAALPLRPLLIANVYDPTFGDDARNFLSVHARLARTNHSRVNAVIGEVASRDGLLVDLHAHFLRGDPTWFTNVIEPSLVGASEVRRAFLDALEQQLGPPRRARSGSSWRAAER